MDFSSILQVTHANILSSVRSSSPHGSTFDAYRMLPYHAWTSQKRRLRFQRNRNRQSGVGYEGFEPSTSAFSERRSYLVSFHGLGPCRKLFGAHTHRL